MLAQHESRRNSRTVEETETTTMAVSCHMGDGHCCESNNNDTDNTNTDNNTNFLVTVRNPVDRIVSWY